MNTLLHAISNFEELFDYSQLTGEAIISNLNLKTDRLENLSVLNNSELNLFWENIRKITSYRENIQKNKLFKIDDEYYIYSVLKTVLGNDFNVSDIDCEEIRNPQKLFKGLSAIVEPLKEQFILNIDCFEAEKDDQEKDCGYVEIRLKQEKSECFMRFRFLWYQYDNGLLYTQQKIDVSYVIVKSSEVCIIPLGIRPVLSR